MPRFRGIRFSMLPLLALPAYVVISSLQACSARVDTAGGGPPPACAPGQTSKHVGSRDLCCTPNGPDWICGVAVGTPCSPVGASQSVDVVHLTTDVCVKESCTGDRWCEEFNLVAVEDTGTLECVNGPGGALWQWQGGAPASTHRVDRACAVTGVEYCYDGTESDQSYSDYAYTPRAYPTGYPYICSYGGYGSYGGGASSYPLRELLITGSVCTSGGVTSPCPVGDL